MIDKAIYARLKEAERQLKIAEAALNVLACWNEGETVTGGFDDPASANKAREALRLMHQKRKKK